MKTEMTAFLDAAKARGCRYQIGSDMLFEQIPAHCARYAPRLGRTVGDTLPLRFGRKAATVGAFRAAPAGPAPLPVPP